MSQLEKMPQKKRKSRTSLVYQLKKKFQRKLMASRTNQLSLLEKMFRMKLMASRTNQLNQLEKMPQRKRKSRNSSDKIEDMAFIRAITRFLSEDQYLKEKKDS